MTSPLKLGRGLNNPDSGGGTLTATLFKVFPSAADQLIAPGAASVLVQNDSIVVDTLGGWNPVTFRFQPPLAGAGWWHVTAQADWTDSGANFSLLGVVVRKNGAAENFAFNFLNSLGGMVLMHEINIAIHLNGTTDFIDMRVNQNNGGATSEPLAGSVASGTYFQGIFLGGP